MIGSKICLIVVKGGRKPSGAVPKSRTRLKASNQVFPRVRLENFIPILI